MFRFLALVFLMLIASAQAHQIAEMTLQISADDGRFEAVIQADAAYMLPEFRGDEDVAAQDLAWLRELGAEEWRRIQRETELYLRKCLSIRSESGPLDWRISFPDFDADPPRFLEEGMAEMLPMIEVRATGDFMGETLSLGWEEPFGVVLIVQAGDETIPVISGYEEAVLQRDASDAIEVVTPSISGWIVLGFRHIIPDGLDHVLFILGIFLFVPRWKPLLAQSLIFTVAHSLTLGCAVLGWVQLPELWVELAIAASIAWIGIENLFLKKLGAGRYALIAVFGLIHGLGFARMLTPLLPEDRPDALVACLAGFNVGVELGQVLVLALAFAVFGWWKEKNFAYARVSGSVLIATAGIAMMVERIMAAT
ncbi:HupE/UreJ family protein [Haloferula chungangensis]|uniref:HupE/UreJ family protein n=1 Tax=Haloferula chungangensis TaxID=1048331 RepID=A0ABW2L4X1_9BACT